MIALKLVGAAVLVGATLSGLIAAAAPAHADPPCAAFGTCKYMPNPWYDGPMMPTWNTPGTYGGWTNLPVMCDPVTQQCRMYAPSS